MVWHMPPTIDRATKSFKQLLKTALKCKGDAHLYSLYMRIDEQFNIKELISCTPRKEMEQKLLEIGSNEWKYVQLKKYEDMDKEDIIFEEVKKQTKSEELKGFEFVDIET